VKAIGSVNSALRSDDETDAAIVCWRAKARWLYWRPITSIHEAAADGNAATEPDATWQPLIPTPPYPEQPPGLACPSSAMAGGLA
jgi:hypothetical protein